MNKLKRPFFLLLITGLLCATGTAAYFSDFEKKINSAAVGYVTTEIEEDFPDPTPTPMENGPSYRKEIRIGNFSGSVKGFQADCYVRMSLSYSNDDIGRGVKLTGLDTANWDFVGGMIVLMVRTNSGFTYPGYIIYLSALYTFYTMITVVVNVVKFRKSGSPILSAAKILNFISAMMSILGLQTAMISRFSENGDNYRKTMNAITGGFVYCIVIFVAVFMLICSRKNKKEGGNR